MTETNLKQSRLVKSAHEIQKLTEVLDIVAKKIPNFLTNRKVTDEGSVDEIEDALYRFIDEAKIKIDSVKVDKSLSDATKDELYARVEKEIAIFKKKATVILFPVKANSLTSDEYQNALGGDVDLMYRASTNDQLTSAERFKFLKGAANSGCLAANRDMSIWYLNGYHVNKDMESSKEYSERYEVLNKQKENMESLFKIRVESALIEDPDLIYRKVLDWVKEVSSSYDSHLVNKTIYVALKSTIKSFPLNGDGCMYVLHLMMKYQRESIGISYSKQEYAVLEEMKNIVMDLEMDYSTNHVNKYNKLRDSL